MFDNAKDIFRFVDVRHYIFYIITISHESKYLFHVILIGKVCQCICISSATYDVSLCRPSQENIHTHQNGTEPILQCTKYITCW